MDGWIYRGMIEDGRMDGWMDGWMDDGDGWIDGWMDG